MTGVSTVTLDREAEGQRLDRWFKRHYPGLAHGHLQKLLRGGQIRLDGRRVKASTRLAAGQALRLPPLEKSAKSGDRSRRSGKSETANLSRREIHEIRSRVLFKDDWIIAIDKPAGLAVQGGTGQRRHIDQMLSALRFNAEEPPRLVHRLDKDTSGVLLLARDALGARRLGTAFRDKSARKLYWALIAGRAPNRQGIVSLEIGKAGPPGREKVVAKGQAAKEAVTLYREVRHRGSRASWILLMPLTGRTHQLRVHMSALGVPILGDGKYGGRQAFLDRPALPRRLMLHAREIAVPHPGDGTTCRIVAPLPPEMEEAWKALDFDPGLEAEATHALLDYAANFV